MAKDPTTEVVVLPLLPGLDLGSGDAKALWESILKTISEQPGYQKMFWGRQVEHPDIAQLCINWDSIEAHKAFMASPAYGPFGETISKLLSAPPSLYHVPFPASSPFVAPARAPAAELASLYFPASYPQADFMPRWAEFGRVCGQHATGFLGCAGGWSIEEVESAGVEGGKAKVFLAVIAWESVEAHMAFRATEAFKGAITQLRGGTTSIEMHHVRFQEY
ncbi:hypothetical protein AOQ84DRAFT_354782 [Glonium stellatum]|uniref:ABM domain-containing protein n=1 Tax=Glonium stellatum TaxID=574774 RepID=A0A8E2EZK3_9PEZI|nr:hypothetical protein AOQ84DRAFT_354782 [Glonium stellatum]